MSAKIVIRHATTADVQNIIRVHFAAVHETASVFYPANVLFAWSANPDEGRYTFLRKTIESDAHIMEVAEVEGIVRGFGSIVPATGELRSLYVEPAFGRRGIAAAILARLEELAAAAGLKQLQLDSSLNAEAFYRKHGYTGMERGVHRLSSGIDMDCVRLSKKIGPYRI